MKGIDDPTLAKTERGVSQSSSSLSYDGTGGRSSFARAQSARIAALFGCCSQLRLCSFSITPCHGQSLFVHAIYERINGRPIDIETSGIGRRCSNTRGLPATDRPLRSSAVPVTDSGSTRSCVVIFCISARSVRTLPLPPHISRSYDGDDAYNVRALYPRTHHHRRHRGRHACCYCFMHSSMHALPQQLAARVRLRVLLRFDSIQKQFYFWKPYIVQCSAC